MARSYIYRCEHKETKRFYIGYRRANELPADQDFGIHYFTSCPEVRDYFNEYTYEILSEYDSPLMAFEVEQRLIYECRYDNLLINKNHKVRNMIQLDPHPVQPSIPYKKLPPIQGPRKRSSPTPKGVKKRKARQRRKKEKLLQKSLRDAAGVLNKQNTE